MWKALPLLLTLSLASCAGELYITEPPPPLQQEVIAAPPYQGAVWTGGYWAWDGGRHVWRPGQYARPPRPGYIYHPHRWEQRGRRWAYVPGRWHHR